MTRGTRGIRPFAVFDAADRAVLRCNFRCPRVPHLYAGLAQIALQRGEDVGRAVGDREDAIAAFGLQRTAVRPQRTPWRRQGRSARARCRGSVGSSACFSTRPPDGQSFVTLQRPFPVMSSFLPRRSFGSSSVTAAPCSAAQPAGHHARGAAADDDDALTGRAHRHHIHPQICSRFSKVWVRSRS